MRSRPRAGGTKGRGGDGDGRRASAGTLRLARNVALWLAPVALVWILLTPLYNRVLGRWGETVTRWTEWPAVTRLVPDGAHYLLVVRADYRGGQHHAYRLRATDLHFNWLLVAALFLAVPEVPWRRRLARLGWASLATAFFQIALLAAWVKFVYATQLGDWSAAHYGPVARNVYGLAKHVLDLPLKLGLPLLLWAGFYGRRLLGEPADW